MDYKLAYEYREVAFRAEHLNVSGRTQEETTLLLDMLEALARPVLVVVRHTPLSQDANDDMVLEVAINGGADAIVTNDTKRFREPAKRFPPAIADPAELLNEFRKRR